MKSNTMFSIYRADWPNGDRTIVTAYDAQEAIDLLDDEFGDILGSNECRLFCLKDKCLLRIAFDYSKPEPVTDECTLFGKVDVLSENAPLYDDEWIAYEVNLDDYQYTISKQMQEIIEQNGGKHEKGREVK